MAATLLEVAQTSESDLQRGIIKRIIETSPLMTKIPFDEKPSMRHHFGIEGKLPASGFRGLNEGFTADDAPDQTGLIQLKQFGGSFDLDDELMDIQNFELDQEVTKQTKKKLRSMALNWKKFFINGDVTSDPKEFDGIRRLNQITKDAGFDTQVDFAGETDGKAITSAADVIDFFNNMINQCIGVPDFFITNRTVGALIDSVLVVAAANNVLATKWSYDIMEIAQGMFATPLRVRVGMWEGIPVFFADEDAAEVPIIAFDETQGASDVTTSIYAVKTGEDFVFGLQKRAQGPIIRQKDSTIGVLTKIDWPSAVSMHHPKSVIRGKGVLES